ncbi:hypothetical protein FGG08_003332 [Glutinoglossum americanum]|uniref:Peptidase metallopeptidase domain-containing protein n=1 Tax=Glutinoglossum americanum TaxID=1670608 RepID=A0A9P8I4G2_9PEZI|nr:hypothetical protein FGG08_003332 [Glutinoglossum americanum]
MSYQKPTAISSPSKKGELINVLKESCRKEQFATLKMGTPGPSVHDDLTISASKYTCSTQKSMPQTVGSPNLAGIMLGLSVNIPRWKKGSTVKWAASYTGYPTLNHATYAASQLNAATEVWNSLDIGVTFEWVTDLEDAAFVLVYGGDQGTVLAESFFPNEEPLNTVFVYQGAFQPGSKNIQKEIFLHELGHILGLRHEFADRPFRGNPTEGGAIAFGERNEFSVMSYNFPPTIQESDKRDTRAFYDFTGRSIGPYTIVDMIPDN